MARFNAFLFLLVVVALTVAFSRGWLVVSSDQRPDGNKVDVHLTVDPGKAEADMEAVKDKVEGTLSNSVATHSSVTPTTAEKTLPNQQPVTAPQD